MPLNLDEIRSEWLNQCGPCDFGMPEYPCACAQGDPRLVILKLVNEVERLRIRLGDIDPYADVPEDDFERRLHAHAHCPECGGRLPMWECELLMRDRPDLRGESDAS